MTPATLLLPATAERMTVTHLAVSITSFASITPERLLAFEPVDRFVVDDAHEIAAALDLLRHVPLQPVSDSFDARWALVFSEGGEETASCFVDRSGELVASGGQIFEIEEKAPELITWLRGTFGEDGQIR